MKIRSIIAIMSLWLVFPIQGKAVNDSIQSVVDEVIWVVGDEAILKSDVEAMRIQAQQEGVRWKGDPDCAIPEQIAVQKLYLHQAAIDSIEVTEAEITQGIEQQIEYMISVIGSREKLEEYHKKNMTQIRNELRESYRERQMVQEMQRHLVKDISVTPADVRRYFADLPQDSVPFVPTEVEVQIISQMPRVDQEEINRVKEELRDYTDRVNKGETSFQTLARMYSEDPGTARRGGELGYTGRGTLDQAFANVVSQEAIDRSLARLDSIRTEILDGKFTFEAGASVISDDKDTRNNNGLMANATQSGRTSRFRLQDLPSEIARAVDTLQVGNISRPFQMINERGKTTCVIAKLKSRTEGHKATITEDFQVMKDVVMEKRRQEKLHEWVVNKIKSTYVRVNDRYRDCQFEYQGWIK